MSCLIEIEVITPYSSAQAIQNNNWCPASGVKAIIYSDADGLKQFEDAIDNMNDDDDYTYFWHVWNDDNDLYEADIDFDSFIDLMNNAGLSDLANIEPWENDRTVTITLSR